MLKANYTKYILHFKLPAGTSRGVLHNKETWFLNVWDDTDPSSFGIGECAVFRGLSTDDRPDYENKLQECCQYIHDPSYVIQELISWPSIRFGVEAALLDLQHGGKRILFHSAFTDGKDGIPINGLIWMGHPDVMKQQVKEKLKAGFRCLKFKVGALQLHEELNILRQVRKEFSRDDLTIRLDANGAFSQSNVWDALNMFATYDIHSIEQPVKAGNWPLLKEICRSSPIPVALDEELIGINNAREKQQLLLLTKPAYIILKPALTGGFTGAMEWINTAEALHIGWWVTSALESNIGLNAIAQWTASLHTDVTQGLGTGGLFTNNIPSPLKIHEQKLWIDQHLKWDVSKINT